MPLPTMTGYENTWSTKGGRSTGTFVCAWADRFTARASIMAVADPNDTSLLCESVRITYLKNDPYCGKAELTASYAPLSKVQQSDVGQPFKFRLEVSGQAVTIKGGYHWADDKPLTNINVLPAKNFTQAKVVLYGTRSSFSLGTYASLVDHVNSDSFLGAGAETIFFESVSVNQTQDKNGNTVYAIELHLIWKPTGFNKFYREDDGAMVELKDDGGAKVYPAAALSGLLT